MDRRNPGSCSSYVMQINNLASLLRSRHRTLDNASALQRLSSYLEMISSSPSHGETPMIRETTAADLPTALGPLLVSLLVVLASLPTVETLRLRLARSVRGVCLPESPAAGVPGSPGPTVRLLDGMPTGFTSPLFSASAHRLKARRS